MKPETREIASAEKDLDLFSGWTGRMENGYRVRRTRGKKRVTGSPDTCIRVRRTRGKNR